MWAACGINANGWLVLLIKEESGFVRGISKHNMTLWLGEPRPALAPYPTSEACERWPFSLFLLSPWHPAQCGRWRRTDSDSGGKGREWGTSEASLVSNKRGDQTCFFACERKYYSRERQGDAGGMCQFRPPMWLLWFSFGDRCGKLKTNVQLLMRHPSFSLFLWFFQLSCLYSFLLFFLCQFFPGWSLRWKLAFLIPPEARLLQNTHFPINKYTKTL